VSEGGGYLGRLWRASAHPGEFFATLPASPRLWEATRAGLLSVAVSSLVFSWAIGRGISSDAWLPILLLVAPGAFLYVTLLWLVGGLALARAGSLDRRGWEVAAWAWVPAGFMAVALLPVVAVFPVTSLAAGLLGLPVWHLAVVYRGLAEFAEHRARSALVIYALVVLAAPLTVLVAALLGYLAQGGAG
jgi:hypothetical protein